MLNTISLFLLRDVLSFQPYSSVEHPLSYVLVPFRVSPLLSLVFSLSLSVSPSRSLFLSWVMCFFITMCSVIPCSSITSLGQSLINFEKFEVIYSLNKASTQFGFYALWMPTWFYSPCLCVALSESSFPYSSCCILCKFYKYRLKRVHMYLYIYYFYISPAHLILFSVTLSLLFIPWVDFFSPCCSHSIQLPFCLLQSIVFVSFVVPLFPL